MSIIRLAACLAVGAAMVACATTSQAASSFDGSWSVSVSSNLSKCEASAYYAIRVANGKVSYDGGDASVSGQVDERGYIRVSIRTGAHGASGSGHLSGAKGVGTWRGQRSAILCSGRWDAQRM